MCYSAEVQLATSLLIFFFMGYYYIKYHRKYFSLRSKWEDKFTKFILFAMFLIGAHQFFEFLSIVTENMIIYKVGLILSISSMYFFLRSFEVLVNKKVHGGIAIFVIVLTAIHLFISDMSFSANSFFVQHNSAFIWAVAWMFLFIYFHVVALREYLTTKDKKEGHELIIFFLMITDISFVISLVYSFFAYLVYGANICTDAPSIWCTFFVIQILFVPLLLSKLHNSFNRRKKVKLQSAKSMFITLIIALIILALLFLIIPFFDCLTWKYVFP